MNDAILLVLQKSETSTQQLITRLGNYFSQNGDQNSVPDYLLCGFNTAECCPMHFTICSLDQAEQTLLNHFTEEFLPKRFVDSVIAETRTTDVRTSCTFSDIVATLTPINYGWTEPVQFMLRMSIEW